MSARTIIRRVFTWVFLLGAAVAAFILAVFLSNEEIGASIVIASQSYGLIENWGLSLIALSIAVCTYFLRGVDGGGWSINVTVLLLLVIIISTFFLFGQYAMWTLGAVSMLSSVLLIIWKQSGI